MEHFHLSHAGSTALDSVCPRDLVVDKNNGLIAESLIPCIAIPQYLPSEDFDMEDEKPPTSPSTAPLAAAEPGDDKVEGPWSEIFDDLFTNSVGLERILQCLEKVQSSEVPPSPIEDEVSTVRYHAQPPMLGAELCTRLIQLYFRQFHPICPAVDETEFLRWYESPPTHHDPRHTQPRTMALLLHAILFAGSSYLEQDELQQQRGPYPTVPHLQKALFTFIQAQYHLLEQEFLGDEPLVQTALLLSYWSPYDGTREVNSFWATEATRHAEAGGLSGPLSGGRSRIIWWCCIIRNRMISVGLRRPSLLEKRIDGRLVAIEDFGLEVTQPRFVSTEAKIYFVRAFHLLCSLTSTMAECAQLKFCYYTQSWVLPCGHHSTQLVEEVRHLDDRLAVWNINFARLYATVKSQPLPQTDLVIFHLLGLMHQFARSILYEPFLRMPRGGGRNPQAWLMQDHAFLKIKQMATNTASITASMLQHSQLKDLPIILLPWLILPIALHLLQLGEHQIFDEDQRGEVIRRLGHLMRVLHALKCRYQGAQFVARIVDAIILFIRKFDSSPSRAWGQSAGGEGRVGSGSSAVRQRQQHSRGSEAARQEDLINQVLEVIRNGLAEEVILD